jgi:hypothetical protein
MTVCIAAVCEQDRDDPKIIICTDRKVSSALGSADTMLKSRTIKLGVGGEPSWLCLTSGTDTAILAIMRSLKEKFRSQVIDDTNAVRLVREALNERKGQLVEELIQGKYAISYQDFLADGKTKLPESAFRTTIAEIEMVQLDAECIVVGYGDYGFPLLIQTNVKCGADLKEDYAAIGEGSYLAQASLMSREHHGSRAFDRSAYVTYEAKKFAEGAPTVGKTTVLLVMHRNGDLSAIDHAGLDHLDATVLNLDRKNVPDNIGFRSDAFRVLHPLNKVGASTS